MALAGTFLSAAATYWLRVWPAARADLHSLKRRAECVPDSRLREMALQTLQQKWTNVEGAAAFAVLVPARARERALRALICWQAAYDLADTLSEHPPDKATDSLQLHQALPSALETPVPAEYEPPWVANRDGQYLRALVEEARRAFMSLPAHPQTAALAVAASERIARYQALYQAPSHTELARWASAHTPSDTGLAWWETSAAAASSLAVLAMIATAGDPRIVGDAIARTEAAYWPFASALHTLLDSLVDKSEDAATGQPSLLDYATSDELADRMGRLAAQAIKETLSLQRSRQHLILLTGMTCLYLSDTAANLSEARPVNQSVMAVIGAIGRPAIVILRTRRLAKRLYQPLQPQSPITRTRRLTQGRLFPRSYSHADIDRAHRR